ncbi:hypothetical protein AVEN_44052-1 [Araneus ventricosus]|uniref:Uncharacterized protein n=1 Tax=Araneus ventricosus TaxID=182803 RepID=A0A4Y2HA38_ARAVE|nr:hypothetical protein AVEN_44052-1 [Araneus ventricosus]
MQPLIEDASKPKLHHKLKIHMLGKQRLHIGRQTPAQSQTRREVNATFHRNLIEAETPAQCQPYREKDAAVHGRSIERQTPHQAEGRRERDAEAHRLVRFRRSQRICDEAIHFIEAQVETHNCGPMKIICQFCK